MFADEWVRPANRGDAAKVQLLLMAAGLDADFVAAEFVVAESRGRIIGCARAKPLPDGGTELASVCVHADFRGRGLARSLVTMALLGARHPVFALTLVPELAARAGFEAFAAAELPASLRGKAAACAAAGRPWTAMRMRRRPIPPAPEEPGAPGFLDL